jgi:Transcriptional regulator PadR-like family
MPQSLSTKAKILQAFDGDVRLELSGAQLEQKTGINSGTLYPVLYELQQSRPSLLKGRWDEAVYPRRKLYSLTDAGYNSANAAQPPNGLLGTLAAVLK